MIVAGTYPAVTSQELEDAKTNLLVQVAVSVVMKLFLKMESALV